MTKTGKSYSDLVAFLETPHPDRDRFAGKWEEYEFGEWVPGRTARNWERDADGELAWVLFERPMFDGMGILTLKTREAWHGYRNFGGAWEIDDEGEHGLGFVPARIAIGEEETMTSKANESTVEAAAIRYGQALVSMQNSFEPECGDDIRYACENLCLLATANGTRYEMDFNEIHLVADPDTTAAELVESYHAECARRRVEYEATPEFRAREEEHARWAAEAKRAEDEGILPFSKRNLGGWNQTVIVNDDPYGACAVRYAARWANLMEKAIERGEPLEGVADRLSHEADRASEGITGFLYGCAVSILSLAWVHGEELRRWHNLKTQIRSEGERANREGGVLNPALLTIRGAS